MKNGFVTLLFLLLCQNISFAQSFTVSGTVKDKLTGENLIGANIYDAVSKKGTSTNQFGYFSFTTNKKSVDLLFSYTGFDIQQMHIDLEKDVVINIELVSNATLDEVVVVSKKGTKFQESTQMSTIAIPIKQIKELPALFGEVDVLKILQLLPGVQSGSEGSSGLYVRGGGPDQNLMLLDGVPIYNAAHLFGFFSIFNADAINTVELIKGGFPARYGGRLSSVVDITLKDGNSNKIKGEGSVGTIAAKFTLEGPIVKGKTTFLVSGRRTYIDALTRPFMSKESNGGYYFYDFNTKFKHIINSNNKLYFSLYNGLDKASFGGQGTYYNDSSGESIKSKTKYGLQWGNLIAALRWNNTISSKLFSNYNFTYSKYKFSLFEEYSDEVTSNADITQNFYSTKYESNISDWTIKADYEYIPSPNQFIRFGASAIFHKFTPGVEATKESGAADINLGSAPINAVESSVYVEDDIAITNKIKTNVGAYFSNFSVNNTQYHSLQPRLAVRYLFNESLSAKASYAQTAQNLHLLSNSGIGLPTDLWVPATAGVGPEKATQYAIGMAKNHKQFEISIEAYYKEMDGLIEYKEGASYLNLDTDWQKQVAIGNGTSYGIEFFVQKKVGKTTGWVGYTWSKTYRQFDDLNFGKEFPYKYDRRNDVSLVLSRKIKNKNNLSLVWVYGTGNAVTLPTSIYSPAGSSSYSNYISQYEDRNAYRYRDYHRLDLSYAINTKKKWGESSWIFSIYNVYNRKNPYFIGPSYSSSSNSKLVQYSLFPVLPSISYTFKF